MLMAQVEGRHFENLWPSQFPSLSLNFLSSQLVLPTLSQEVL